MFLPRSLRFPASKPAPAPSKAAAKPASTPARAIVNTTFAPLPSVNPIPDKDPSIPTQTIAPIPSGPISQNNTLSLVNDYDEVDDDDETNNQVASHPTEGENREADEAEEGGEDAVIMYSRQQRFALAGEPICVICNRFGEYICDETEQDVCSMECKKQHLEEFQEIQAREQAAQTVFKLEKTVFYSEHPDIQDLSDQQVMDIRHEVQITIKGDNIPRPILEFAHCGFPEKLIANANAENYNTPTPIQMQTIPIALNTRDMMACAATGSGKTACFVLPALYHILAYTPPVPEDKPPIYVPKPLALILAPTRELCMQIEDQIKPLSLGLPIRTALVVGGLPMPNQVYRLRSNVQIIVATPGRLIDILVKHPELDCLGNVNLLVLDEVDMMLQMGFENQVMQLVKALGDHQTLLFSATIPPAIEKMGHTILNDPVFVAVGSPSTPTSAVKQTVLWVENKMKKKKLFDLLGDPKYYHPPIVVFVDSKKGADMLAEAVTQRTGISTVSIHGDKTQTERTDILKSFIAGEHPIIVSTAVLGRGLDLLRVDMVVNFDMPPSIQEYIHQIGRAGRLGRSGWAVTFVNNEDKSIFSELVQMCNALKITVPNEILNSPYLKALEKKRKAQAAAPQQQKRGGDQDAGGIDSWKKELDRKRRK